MDPYQIIGTPTRRVDGAAKATGQARYAADVSLPGTLRGKSLHSPYAHARDAASTDRYYACRLIGETGRCW